MNPVAADSTRPLFGKSAKAAALAIGAGAAIIRLVFGPQFDGLDDAGYLDAALRVSDGRPLDTVFPLFRTRVGMAYPLGGLLAAGVLAPAQFWWLTLAADMVTVFALIVTGALLGGAAIVGLCAAALYAIYPLAIQQSAMYYPTAFQVASIATACALIALAERASEQRRVLYALAAGLSLGIGYLFKEDVAVVVPALVIAAAVTRFPRFTTVMMVCVGAAAIFAIECAGYWLTTGNPAFRLSATSGLGAPVNDQLQIAEIWRPDAFLRSLFLLPVQVGIMWWVAIVAVWIAWRRRRSTPALAFVAVLFVAVMAYLQFGSGSLTTYSPLPKTPRYTALATPALMLVTGGWLAMLLTSRRRTGATALAAIVLAALPCIVFLQFTSSERTQNTLAVLPALESLEDGVLYTDYYSARVLRLLAPGRDIRVWYHAKFHDNTVLLMNEPEPGSYVLFDRQSAKIYTSGYQLPLPKAVEQHPREWAPVWTRRAYPEGALSRKFLEGLHAAALRLPGDNPLSRRIDRNIQDMLEHDRATLFRVPANAARSFN